MGQARALDPGRAHEGYINIFCGMLDPLCGVIHRFIIQQKLYFLVLSYVVYHRILLSGGRYLL